MRIILNPTSGGGAGRKARAEIERELSRRALAHEITETGGRGHAVELAEQAALEGVSSVVAAGGDGTIHEVVNGLLRARGRIPSQPVLGVIPIGTGNDFAKLLALGEGRAGAYDRLRGDVVRTFDVGVAEWNGGSEYFVNGMGTGIDVEVVRQIERFPSLPGTLRYLAGLVRALIRFRPIQLAMRVDGTQMDRKVMIIAVGNGRCIGGGFHLCPAALPDDGKLDLSIINEVSYWEIGRLVPRILRGTHLGHHAVEMKRLDEIEISAGNALFFQLDGELRESKTRRVRVRVEPHALKVHG
jgi:diacylglycerol kinase (ATP)